MLGRIHAVRRIHGQRRPPQVGYAVLARAHPALQVWQRLRPAMAGVAARMPLDIARLEDIEPARNVDHERVPVAGELRDLGLAAQEGALEHQAVT